MAGASYFAAAAEPRLAVLALGLVLAACRPGQPCPSCEDDEAELGDVADVPADLPCGGADLQTDDFNCGECGNICTVKADGTDYEAGGMCRWRV